MDKYYKLIDMIDVVQRVNFVKDHNGRAQYRFMDLEPGEIYELPDDKIFIDSLKRATVEKKYSTELIDLLNKYNVPYTERYCKSCGSKLRKVKYNIVEVVE